MQDKIKELIERLEKSYINRLDGSELMQAYYGEGDSEFSDWMSGNFDDDVDLGNRIGSYEVACEVCSALLGILEEN